MEQTESRRKFDQSYQDVFVPWVVPADKNEKEEEKVVYDRYYHLFKKGELDDLVADTGLAQIIKSDYDKDNWYVMAEKKENKNRN